MPAPAEEPPSGAEAVSGVSAEEPADEIPAGDDSEEPAPFEEPAPHPGLASVDRLLLDTHVFLWWRASPAKIRAGTREAIARAGVVFVSVASAWEAAIKIALGRLTLPDTIEAGALASGFEKLPITFSHTELVTTLPHHHRDPFDRMLIAQAISESLTLVTNDRQLEAYQVPLLRA